MQSTFYNNHGFTWLELIVVMVVIGFISAVTVGGLMTRDTELVSRTEVIKTHLRYAQSRSLNTNTVWYLQFSSNSYSLYKYGEDTPKRLPGGDSATVTLPGAMSMTLNPDSSYVSFDNLGKPCTDSGARTAQTADRTLTVTDSSGSRTITITKNTGFIQ